MICSHSLNCIFPIFTKNTFFTDGKADRLPVTGTAIRGNLISQDNVFSTSPNFLSEVVKTGKLANGDWVNKIPDEIDIDLSLMRLGKDKYDIHCAVCHGPVQDHPRRL